MAPNDKVEVKYLSQISFFVFQACFQNFIGEFSIRLGNITPSRNLRAAVEFLKIVAGLYISHSKQKFLSIPKQEKSIFLCH